MDNPSVYKVLCQLSTRERVCFGLTAKPNWPSPSSAVSQPSSALESTGVQLPLPRRVSVLTEGGGPPHRPLESPYVFRAMDTIFSSHVILVSLRMLYHTMPAGRTSSLRQNR